MKLTNKQLLEIKENIEYLKHEFSLTKETAFEITSKIEVYIKLYPD